ncbi:benzoyl-CoA reductase/2-hydroxyglutaryl-CoA dehydratase subunit BcrC/BadD/HgdB [Clostridium sp. CAG:299]|nr:benzoyl-CoA reductase/2-hydroxyglutaryl-CoA dehydratase subunit BcrC/BadD/HgdB [Clostridium sp. CAG:299]
MMNLPENFVTYDEARKAGFIKMKELKEKGARVVGVFCSFVPVEILMAGGAVNASLCASSEQPSSEQPIPAAETKLPRNLCPLIKASYGFALTDTCPYFYFADLIVGETTCDGKKKMFELMNELKETYVMQLPAQRNERGLDLWKKEIIALKEKLEDFYGIQITEEDIKKAIRLKNRERKAMLRFMELGKLYPSPISGYEISTVSDSLGFNFDMEDRIRRVEERTEEVLKDWEENYKGKTSKRPRLLITGCPNGGVRDKIIKTVEEMGADVVAFDSCSGTREKVEEVDENMPVFDALAKKYLNINCSVMSPNDSRQGYIKEMIHEYQADGVVEIILQSCHTYNIEAHFIKRTVEAEGIPYLMIETDYSKSDQGQIATRLEALLETIS